MTKSNTDETTGLERTTRTLERTPSYWMTTDIASLWKGQRVSINPETGLRESRPAVAYVGTDGYSAVPHPDGAKRSVLTVRTDGNVVDVVLTNAAGDLDTQSPYAHWQRHDAFMRGWLPWAGTCLVREVAAGRVRGDRIEDPTLRALFGTAGGRDAEDLLTDSTWREHMCDRERLDPSKPCPHTVAERDARRSRHTAEMAKADDASHAERRATERTIAEAAARGMASALEGLVSAAVERSINTKRKDK